MGPAWVLEPGCGEILCSSHGGGTFMRGLVGREVDSNGAMNGQLGEGGLFQEDCVSTWIGTLFYYISSHRGVERFFSVPQGGRDFQVEVS